MIFIIGGSGFIGTVLEEIFFKNHIIFKNIDKNCSLTFNDFSIVADIRNKDELVNAFSGCSNNDWIILLAAEHRDDITPVSLYHEVNVEGTKNVLKAMEQKGINKIIFTSTVAIYGLNKTNPTEQHPPDPFNPYGKSKWQAEELLREWYNRDKNNRTLIIIRPTVVFGPKNRGNVYNFLKQILSGRFLMIGRGNNIKSMAYVENIAEFIKYCTDKNFTGYHLLNYVDKPDLTTNELVKQAGIVLNKKVAPFRIPYFLGYAGGFGLDIIAKIFNKKFSISSIRVKKFCANTQFSSENLIASGFKPPYKLEDGLVKTIKSIVDEEHRENKKI